MSTLEGYAVVELLGKRVVSGRVQEVEIAGAKLLRVDVALPDERELAQFYGGGAIYCLTPVPSEYFTREERIRNESALYYVDMLPEPHKTLRQQRVDAEYAARQARYALPGEAAIPPEYHDPYEEDAYGDDDQESLEDEAEAEARRAEFERDLERGP